MRAKKDASRRPSLPPTDDPFFIRPVPSPTCASPSQPFSALAFDEHMGLPAPTHAATTRNKDGGTGLGKKLLSFPWTRSDKKHAPHHQLNLVETAAATAQPVASGSGGAAPPITALPTTTSLPLGISGSTSLPVAAPADTLQRARQRPSFVVSNSHVPGHQQSNASLSTIRTTSSSASTALFYSSEDGGWHSEATSLTSSPDSGRDDKCTPPHLRMWRVRGLAAEGSTTLPDIAERENEDVRLSIYDGLVPPNGRETPTRRNSTPIPSAVAVMLGEPSTPPRPKRYSASSVTLSPASQDKLASARREAAGSEADDEVSPPRARRTVRRAISQDLLLESPQKGGRRFSPSSHRIPSISFEGISMDAFFAEVEANVNLGLVAGGKRSSPPSSASTKQTRRRTRVLSAYMPPPSPPTQQAPVDGPVLVEEDEELESPIVPVAHLVDEDGPLLAKEPSTPPSPGLALDVPRPRPHPRRSSSRPAPLDVAAANALSTWAPISAPLQPSISLWSPPADGTASPSPVRTMALPPVSPPLAGGFIFSPRVASSDERSPGLAAPFNPAPSPALSSTSTFKPSDIPELLVCPPSPPLVGEEPVQAPIRPRQRRQSLQALPQRASHVVTAPQTQASPPPPPVQAQRSSSTRRAPPRPLTIINGPTKVTVLPEKKTVRLSSRVQASKRKMQGAPARPMSSPPPPPLVEVTPPPPPSLPLLDEYDHDDEYQLSSPSSPTLPFIPVDTYRPSDVLRTDFHPALSGLTVPASPQRSQHTPDSDSSDCEETLHNMLLRLNRPHTPPAPASLSAASSEASLSLTELALELHNTSQARLSMLACEMGSSTSSSRAGSSSSKENAAFGHDDRSASACSRRSERRYSRLYDGVDIAYVASPTPRTCAAPEAVSPTFMHQSLVAQSEHGRAGPSSWESEADVPTSPIDEDDDECATLESELDRTLATLVGEQAESAFSPTSSSSAQSSSSSSGAPRRRAGHTQTDSASSLDYLGEAPGGPSASTPARERVPRSGSHDSQLTASSFDSNDSEEGVVCLGERVSCMYNVGVIGVAM
ncbi:hypothetical protein JCM3775_000569 [Rhodotorula graminis]|uniref:Uncharacterized protein n=1 Tax=Rhodotorula graminis (strain WP1) TaxID=578459 RepID=A0A0P9EWU5_RHOGW|nr:uncharacterized protein RHOBADRAFT_54424 [Rhodotorula graminis WP1]KPV73828.1 hypothetical protein RHOBADRAFT_54424 [Rhodotorula graminis WP1]